MALAKTWRPMIPLFLTDGTGDKDERAHASVELQPKDQAYPTGAIDCTQSTNEKNNWLPDSNLTTNTHYWIYVNGDIIGALDAIDSYPNLGG